MCGIFFSSGPIPSDRRRLIEAMLARRGLLAPAWHESGDGSVAAHSLLPVRGDRPFHQPVVTRDIVLLFAGELWDVERGSCDTPVMLDRLLEFGTLDVCRRTSGNYAFLWKHNGVIDFGTDRMGEQPLHYARVDSALVVGSEVKLLVAAGAPLSTVRHVEPGRLYRFRRSELSIMTYIDKGRAGRWRRFDPVKLRRRVRQAVSEQVVSLDLQEAAVLFSGGIDSSIVAYEAARLGVRRAFTVVASRDTIDAVRARAAAAYLGLEWSLSVVAPSSPDQAIVCGEVSNRSIVEELCLHIKLAAELSRLNIRVLLTGSGADEAFVGYGHLFRRMPPCDMQHRFLSTYYRYDLRAFNKLYGGFAIELRNPFLSRTVLEYARRMHHSLLIGPKRELKWPLRSAYAEMLGDSANEPKLIARESMGVKQSFLRKLGSSPYVYRAPFKELLSSSRATAEVLAQVAAT